MLEVKKLENITTMSIETQNQKLRQFARVDISTKLKILNKQKQIFHQKKPFFIDEDKSILTLASLILAIDKVTKSLDNISLNSIEMRVKNHKSNVKREKLLGYWAIVKALREEQKMSFRNISKYFMKYHRFIVSYSLIYELWTELEINNMKEEKNG